MEVSKNPNTFQMEEWGYSLSSRNKSILLPNLMPLQYMTLFLTNFLPCDKVYIPNSLQKIETRMVWF